MLADLLDSPVIFGLLTLWLLLAVVASYWVSGRLTLVSTDDEVDMVRRIARNSVVPIVSQLFIRGTDLAVAIVVLRLLGPEGNGRYAIAVVVWLYVKTLSDFGLSLLATADIARDHAMAGQIVGETTLLRLLVLAISGFAVAIYVLAGIARDSLATESAVAIGLLYFSVVPSSYAEAVNSALNGFERMEIGALLNIAVSCVRAPLAVLLAVLLGVEGVALSALVAAAFSAMLYRRTAGLIGVGGARWSLSPVRARRLAARSWPLLINALLVNLFFRVDVFIIQAVKGDEVLGIYDASYKLIGLVTIVPAYVTLAIFPAMAQRSGDPGALERTLRTASYFLVWIAWGIVAVTSATAGAAIHVLAGPDYLPDAASLLRILIWFAPLSFLNGVIQYALVASEQQRRIVPAFCAAVVCNLALNLALVPTYGARAAAVATVVTEIVILLAFSLVTRDTALNAVTTRSLLGLWRPSVAGVAASVFALVIVDRQGEILASVVALAIFAILSIILRVFSDREREIIRRALHRSAAQA